MRENGEFLAILRNERVSGIQKPIIRRSSDQRDLCNETVIQIGKEKRRQTKRAVSDRIYAPALICSVETFNGEVL